MKRWMFLFLVPLKIVSAQSYQDEALLFSRSSISGTARTVGSAGAYGSVGADLGSLSINPAGIGLYRSTDFSITPALVISSNDAHFDGNTTDAAVPKVYFNQAGIVFTKIFEKAQKKNDFSFNPHRLKTFSFAINYQRQSMFSRTQNFEGTNNVNSGVSANTDYLNATGLPLSSQNYSPDILLGYETYLIDTLPGTNNYFSNVHAPVRQSGSMLTKGAADQIDLTFGGNVNDKFYFGAGMGISILSQSADYIFTESNSGDTLSHFRDYTFSSNLKTSGFGINAKFGIIYRPVSWMRLGVTYQIPTFYSLTENYQGNVNSNFDTIGYSASGYYSDKYKLRTPMKGVVSSSFYFKDHGFFSVDYEFLNYGSSHFNFGTDYKSFSDEVNAYEKQTYGFGHIIRAGVEVAYKSLRVRGGYSFSSTPYKKNQFTKGFAEAKHNASVGIGYRGRRFYADFAYQLGFMKDASYPYADFEVKNTNITHSMFLTLGWKINKDPAKNSKSNTQQREF